MAYNHLNSSCNKSPFQLPSQCRFIKVLGEGSFGTVVKCWKKDTREAVAVKIPKFFDEETINEVSMLREFRRLNLDKKNIVKFIDSFHTKFGKAIMFEALDISIEDYVQRHRYAPMLLSDIRTIIQQVATAFDALKRNGVIHTDIKPDNIMMVNHWKQPFKVKLIDFGLAMPTSNARPGMQLQPVVFRSPEIILGLPFSEAIDMWSLGIMMAFMICGADLFPAESDYELVALSCPSSSTSFFSNILCQAAKVESVVAPGGPSRFSVGGGGGGAPQHYPKTVCNSESLGKTPGSAVQRWVPSRTIRRDANSYNEKGQKDAIFRKVRGILNKLTPEKFDKLCLELLNVGVDSKLVLKGIILLIVDKALEEPKYSQLYAQLCLRLAEDAPNFEDPTENQGSQKQNSTFRRLLISKLQDEFENRARNVDTFDKHDSPLTSDEEEQRAIAKIKMLGNIKFIGELGKLNLIHESILHKCIKTLLDKKKRVQLKDMGEDLECLCQIMKTVGPKLDHTKARSLMDQYFGRMQSLTTNKELPARIRFLLQNTVELRGNNWAPRKAHVDNGPKTINQVRQDAVKDLGVFIPPPSDAMRNDFFMENFLPTRIKFDREPLGGLADMFGQMPGIGIGTGPGVIQDHYSPTMGRHRTNPHYNGHMNGNGSHQPQFEAGSKPYVKPNQGQNSPVFSHKQNHSAQMQSKDMAPRFSKKGKVNADEISLRPAQSFILNKKQVQKPQMTMIPSQGSPGQSPQLGLKHNPPPIQEKPAKSTKKAPPTKEELQKMTETLLGDYLNSKNIDEAVNAVREMKAPKHFLPEMLNKMLIFSLDRSDEDKEHASSLIHALCTDGIVTGENLLQAFLGVLDQCPKIEEEVPLVKSYLAQFSARAIIADLISITDLAHQLENGAHFPLFLLCLQQMVKLRDREWLTELIHQSKVNMLKMLPECDQNKDKMLEILEGKGLSFLFPLMKLEKELLKQIKVDPSPQSIYKWIKDNISPKLHTDKGFVNILMTSFLQYIAYEINPDDDEEQLAAPSKEQLDEEKQLLLSFKPVMQKFLHDHINLQVGALYALQVHCNAKSFPKGMLLRYFVNFYDMEIIEEEAFLSWKEDVNQDYPGKGKALFQVNQWLTWLETAEEEESEDEDY